MATKIKYYKSEIANQPISKGTITINFIICEIIAQKFMGVLKTDDAAVQEILDSYFIVDDDGVKMGTRGLSESTEEEYEHFLKKKVIHDSRQVYQSKPHQAQPRSNSVATVPAADKKTDGEDGKDGDGIELPSTSNPDSGTTDTKEEDLGNVETVKGDDAPATAANYTQLATKLSDDIGVTVTPDELKALKDRPDAPQKQSGKGYSVLQWKAFLTKVAGESSTVDQ